MRLLNMLTPLSKKALPNTGTAGLLNQETHADRAQQNNVMVVITPHGRLVH